MTTADALDEIRSEVSGLIGRLHDGRRDDHAFDALARRIGAVQIERCEPIARLAARARDATPPVLVPTDVFRYARLSVRDSSADRSPGFRVFRTSGTTLEARGQHEISNLSLYEISARYSAKHFLFPDVEAIDLVSLVPDERVAPDSSLSFMLTRFADWFGKRVHQAVDASGLDLDVLVAACELAERSGEPIALLGTSFAFVHAEDALGDRVFRLPTGSRVMQTGGFKGRSREVSADVLRAAISARYGVPDAWIVGEYGMTELSSQLYETTLRHALVGDVPSGRAYGSMGWARASVLDVETLRPVATGQRGLVRIDDLANVESAVAVLTGDLGSLDEHGRLSLLGRATDAEARGCSIAADVLLAGDPP